jgi:hypothetical protein
MYLIGIPFSSSRDVKAARETATVQLKTPGELNNSTVY